MPMDQLVSQGVIQNNIFAFYLALGGKTGSTVTLGGTESKFHTGDFFYFPVAKSAQVLPYWLISWKGISVGGKTFVSCDFSTGCYMAVNVGTSVIAGPRNLVEPLLAQIGDIAKDCSNFDKLPSLTFSIGGLGTPVTNFTLGPEFYMFRLLDGQGKPECRPGIQGLHANVPFWILGKPFLRKYYTVWDANQSRVG